MWCCHRNWYIANLNAKEEQNLVDQHAEDERFEVKRIFFLSNSHPIAIRLATKFNLSLSPSLSLRNISKFAQAQSPCPSSIKVEEIGEEHHVIYVRTHYGFCCDLQTIAISDETQETVSSVFERHRFTSINRSASLLQVKTMSANDCYDRMIVKQIRKELKNQNHTDSMITTRNVADILKSGEF